MRKLGIASFVLGLSILACQLPGNLEVAPAPTASLTPAPALAVPPTITPQPSATPLPTLIPVTQIEDADRAFFYGNWSQALSLYQNALNQAPDAETQAAALLGLGKTYYQLGEYPKSLEFLRQVVENFSESAQVGFAHFALAQTYEALLRYTDAVDAYDQYLQTRGGVLDSYVQELRGDSLVATGDFQQAIDVYQAAISAPRLGDPLLVEMKIASVYAALGDYQTAIVAYQDVYTRSVNDYTKAEADFLLGQAYAIVGDSERANRVYLDAVENYPLSYYAYQSLIELVDADYPVSEYDRGLIDYFAGQYSLAIAAFNRYLSAAEAADQAGSAHYYKGMAYLAINDPEAALESWQIAATAYPGDDHWIDSWNQMAYVQWAYLGEYSAAIETMLNFVGENAWHPQAAEFLFNAALIAERDGQLARAAQLWERIPPEYPSSERVQRAIFLAAITYYRLGDYAAALSTFDWYLGSSAVPAEKSAGYFWLAKTYLALDDAGSAAVFFQNAANQDPTGYYSERARDFILAQEPFAAPVMYDIGFDLAAEKNIADSWVRSAFAVPESIDLNKTESFHGDLRFVRGNEFWQLGLYELARAEFESLRLDIVQNPTDTYRLANYLAQLGLYRSAIFGTRRVLDLYGMDDAATLNAPAYFNHQRFGTFYRELVLPAAESYQFHPLFLFSVIRQESLFEGFVRSSAGARGLMQIMPATGASIAANANWPPGYTDEDLYRPYVNVTLGADYLAAQRDYFDGNLYAALAAYNAGPGNAAIWWGLANGDSDLFLEIIRFEETRNYVKGIYEVFSIYYRLYDRSP